MSESRKKWIIILSPIVISLFSTLLRGLIHEYFDVNVLTLIVGVLLHSLPIGFMIYIYYIKFSEVRFVKWLAIAMAVDLIANALFTTTTNILLITETIEIYSYTYRVLTYTRNGIMFAAEITAYVFSILVIINIKNRTYKLILVGLVLLYIARLANPFLVRMIWEDITGIQYIITSYISQLILIFSRCITLFIGYKETNQL